MNSSQSKNINKRSNDVEKQLVSFVKEMHNEASYQTMLYEACKKRWIFMPHKMQIALLDKHTKKSSCGCYKKNKSHHGNESSTDSSISEDFDDPTASYKLDNIEIKSNRRFLKN